MKKVLLTLAAIALVGIAFTSCSKSCSCTTTVNGIASATVENSSVSNESDCEALSVSTAVGSVKCSWE